MHLVQAFGQLETAHPGHDHVCQQEIDPRAMLLGYPERLGAVAGLKHGVAPRLYSSPDANSCSCSTLTLQVVLRSGSVQVVRREVTGVKGPCPPP